MTAATDSLENRTLDHRFRGQPDTPAATLYLALFTSATTDAGGGTEVTGNGYARVAIPCTLAAWSGTQGAGTTVASTGTAGTISNNAPVEFPTPTGAGWGTPTNWALMTAPTGGAMEIHAPITTPKAIAAGAPVSYPAGTLTISMA